jgi:hypothetical protein
MNIIWTNGGGHSVVFLGWFRDRGGRGHLLTGRARRARTAWATNSFRSTREVSEGRPSDQPVGTLLFRSRRARRAPHPGDPVDFAESDL